MLLYQVIRFIELNTVRNSRGAVEDEGKEAETQPLRPPLRIAATSTRNDYIPQ